ncbi:spermidine/putrescine ABC transporter permease [Williamsoniiplasma somnilux]|uniref:Spermidine/putrescine ABC transporter permease n=1 Tax=Williamsoniiplasma somnilux TaxID=215578 RepID=A0A2K8NYS3_9MOLU|nr:spermidine/putrescine ABC transporter permease [Williamsoniiplasma somnilux]ATZ18965.1 spermidine/putrescine ABC transporter permease [Williamsoniiplasma somnilux]
MPKLRKKVVEENFNQAELDTAIDQEVKRQSRLQFKDLSKAFSNTKIFNFAKDKAWPILLPFFIVMLFLIVLPLVSIIIYSVVQPTGNAIMFKVTFENFIQMFTSSSIMLALSLSVAYALIAALLCVIIGYPIALIMAQLKSKILARNMWVLVTMPIWISMLLKILGLQTFFYMLSPTFIGTPISVIVGMVYMFLPFAITPIYDSLESRQLDLEEAAKDLGASSWKSFWSVTFRYSIPGVLTAFSLVIVQAATSLIVVHYLGDGKVQLISSVIESYFFKGNNFGYGAAISVVLTAMIFLLMLIIRLLSNKFETKGKRKWKNSSKVVTSQL